MDKSMGSSVAGAFDDRLIDDGVDSLPDEGRRLNGRNLQSKLILLTLFRLLVAVVFLLATFLFGLRREFHFLSYGAREMVYVAVSGLLFLCVIAGALLERWEDKTRLTLLGYAHFVGDALFASALVLLTGGCDSIFTFLYSLAIINASIVLYRKGALFAATANAVSLGIIASGQVDMLGESFRSLLSSGTVFGEFLASSGKLGDVLPSLTVNILAFYGIAFLSSFLAEQMRAADVQAREHKLGLEELTNLHENIVSSLENGLITLNRRREIAFINSVACSLLGKNKEEVLKRKIEELFPDMGPVLENPDKASRSHTETTIQLVGGRKTYLRWTISPLKDGEGRQVGHILLFFDITKLKEMEEEVLRAERMAALGRLSANIAHEIRNPLASMSGSIQLLADSLNVDDNEKRLMEIVVREAEHLNQWISDFLEYSRPRKPMIEEMDLGELVLEVISMIRHDDRAREVDITHEGCVGCRLDGDRHKLRQVIWNLVINAVEAAGPGGRVAVQLADVPESATLHVSNSGPGIDPKLVSRIFEPFFTTKSRGTGLGLATVHRNVEEHNGSIQVRTDSEEGGTTFVAVLPRRRIPSTLPDDSGGERN